MLEPSSKGRPRGSVVGIELSSKTQWTSAFRSTGGLTAFMHVSFVNAVEGCSMICRERLGIDQCLDFRTRPVTENTKYLVMQ